MRYLEIREAFIKDQAINRYAYELKYGSVRADIVERKNNDTITYEIKAEGDSFSRLKKQLDNYLDFSNKLFIIIPKSKLKSTFRWLDKHNYKDIVGIYIYFEIQDSIKFEKVSRAKKTKIKINSHKALINIPRKDIYLIMPNLKGDIQSKIAKSISQRKLKTIWNNFVDKKFLQNNEI